MKIEGPKSVNPVQAYQKYAAKESKAHSHAQKGIDEVQISSEAQSMLVQNESDVTNSQKIADIKSAISQGTYQINSRAIAEKIYNSWFNGE